MKEIIILEKAHEYIQTMKSSEQAKLQANLEVMESGDFEMVTTKQLRKKIRELIFGKHRFVYFEYSNTLYFTNAFYKKSQKTPKREIDYAETIYKQLQ